VGDVRVLGIEGVITLCDRIIIINISANGVLLASPVCDVPAYRVLVPRDIHLPFAEVDYGASLMEELQPAGGCSTDGSSVSVTGDVDVGQRTIVLQVDGRAKLKCFGATIVDVSGTIKVSVKFDGLPVCGVGKADIDADFFGARFKAKACVGPGFVYISELCLYARYRGKDYKLACGPDFAIPVPFTFHGKTSATDTGCGCDK
jgi:hypothetical protein